MADVAISAAVVQFLDIAVRLTLQLSSLYKQVQDVPEKLQYLQADIDQQITIARYVQSTHATFWNASPPITVVSMSINQPLTDYVAIMEQLLETVKIITKSNDIGIIRRSWSALRAIQKCKEAITLCDALEKKKIIRRSFLFPATIADLGGEHRGQYANAQGAVARTVADGIGESSSLSGFTELTRNYSSMSFETFCNIVLNYSNMFVMLLGMFGIPPLRVFLLDSGSDPNVYRLADQYDGPSYSSWCKIGGTVLDAFAIPLVCQEPSLRYDSATASLVYEKLVNNNAYFSRPMSEEYQGKSPHYFFWYFKQQMEQFNTFEEQHEVCNLTDLMIAIIHRAEADFDRAIANGSIHENSDANGLTAIYFATFWPKALRRLIRAGANVNCEDRLGRRPIHLAVGCGQAEATLILLEADCSIYTPKYSCSLLQESLKQGRDFDYVTTRIIDTLIDRHTRLIDWVSSLLPESPTLAKHLGQDYIDEMDAPKLIDELVKFKCPLPQSLKVDCDAKGVYDTADFKDRVELTVPLADQLWNGGFRRVDEPARLNDLTPLLQSWYMANFEMVSWTTRTDTRLGNVETQ
ncbi:hypothetical protein G7054_g12450 [Neopestalotiopsis clavispora]|nr:hypothetical protein G7054_g12450 [Neopestalotiopsis clavispora]